MPPSMGKELFRVPPPRPSYPTPPNPKEAIPVSRGAGQGVPSAHSTHQHPEVRCAEPPPSVCSEPHQAPSVRPSAPSIRPSRPFPAFAVSFPRSSASPFVPPWPPPGVSVPVPGCAGPVPPSCHFLSVCPLLIPISPPSRVPLSVCPCPAVPASPCPFLLCSALSPADPHPHLWVSPPPPPCPPAAPVLLPVLVWVSHSGAGWALVTLSRAVQRRAVQCRRGGLSRARPARPLPPPAPGGGGAVTGAVPGPARAEPSGAGPRRAEPCGTGPSRAGPRSPMNGIAFCLVGIPPPAVSRAGRRPPGGWGETGTWSGAQPGWEGVWAAAPRAMLTPEGSRGGPGRGTGSVRRRAARGAQHRPPPPRPSSVLRVGTGGAAPCAAPWGGEGAGRGSAAVVRWHSRGCGELSPRVPTQSRVRPHPSVPGCRDSASPAPQWGNHRPRRINCRAKRIRNEQSCSSQRLGVNRGFPLDSSALTLWGWGLGFGVEGVLGSDVSFCSVLGVNRALLGGGSSAAQ